MLSRIAYEALTLGASAAALPFFLLNRRGRERLSERFGAWNLPPARYLWAHGASVGEMNGLSPLLAQLRPNLGEERLLVSATTVTGLARAEAVADERRLLPLDNSLWIERALGKTEISRFLFGETELWPALLGALQRRGVPCAMVNAKISDFTFRRYEQFSFLFSPLIRNLRAVLAVTESSRDRFIRLGVAPDRITVTGNCKYDHSPSIGSSEEAAALKRDTFVSGAPVLVLGSVHPGEERPWFDALRRARTKGIELNTIVAPRHSARLPYFERTLGSYGLPFERWSELGRRGSPCPEPVLLVDAMGVLEKLFSFADCAFIGGSLVELGGHNPLEAAAYGVPLALGSSISNIAELVEQLAAEGGYTRIGAQDDLLPLLEEVAGRSHKLIEMGEKARLVWQSASGATARALTALRAAGLVES